MQHGWESISSLNKGDRQKSVAENLGGEGQNLAEKLVGNVPDGGEAATLVLSSGRHPAAATVSGLRSAVVCNLIID